MKTEKNILWAFILNLSFSVFEYIGGIITGSVAIISDAVHDIGDAISIGAAFVFERKSKKKPNETYTYGYTRFSVLGSVITTFILLAGAVWVMYKSVLRMIHPAEINYNSMIIFAIVGVCVNLFAALLTRSGDSLNQKSVNLHMLEDVLGWIVVLLGAVVMRFTDLYILDPLMSMGVAIFIFICAAKNLKEALPIFLERVPRGISLDEIKKHICEIEGVADVHHIHIWSIDGHSHAATMHIEAKGDAHRLKEKVRATLKEHGISHATLEFEEENEPCREAHCHIEVFSVPTHHHHHH